MSGRLCPSSESAVILWSAADAVQRRKPAKTAHGKGVITHKANQRRKNHCGSAGKSDYSSGSGGLQNQ